MPLLPDGLSGPPASADPQCLAWAGRLRDALHAGRKVSNKAPLHLWAAEFARLKKLRPPEEITRVLAWYCDHIGGDFVPQAYSAASFKIKYAAIAAAMTRDVPEACEVSEADVRLAERLNGEYVFPTEVKALLPGLVALSRRNWQDFTRRMIEYRDALPEADGREVSHLNHVLHVWGSVFLGYWFAVEARRLYGVGHHGSPFQAAFHPTREAFAKMWRHWADLRTGCPTVFDDLLKRLVTEENHV
jgi:hypothetical protein